jgi:serine/threonine protein kinase
MSLPSRSGESLLPSIDDFLRAIVRSGLMTEAAIAEALSTLSPGTQVDARAIADHLIRNGKLSRFQAYQLLKGRSQGLLIGPFQVLALIGKGGIGTVYLVRDQRDNRLVALKVLSPHRARREERMIRRFQREMDLCQRVNHPHIAQTYEVGQWRDIFYIAMEFIPGKNLFRTIADSGPMEPARAARIGAEVVSALGHAHEQGLVHRDLKPSNILITPHGHAKVLDLGLALLEGEEVDDPRVVGGQGYIVGSMDYIAPEQTYDAAGVDGRADIYSLGCTLYFILAGHPPFPGGSKRDKIQRHRTAEPVPLLQLRPSLPANLVEIVHQMLAKDPGKRPPSARAVEQTLLSLAPREVLPLDRTDDITYTQAVADLKNAEPPSEFTWSESAGSGSSVDDSFTQTPKVELGGHHLVFWLVLGLSTALLLLIAVMLVLHLTG